MSDDRRRQNAGTTRGPAVSGRRSARRHVAVAFVACALIIVLAPAVPLLILMPLVVVSLFGTWQQVAGLAVAAAALTLVLVDAAGRTPQPGTTAEVVLAGGLGAAALVALRQRFRDVDHSSLPSAWLHTTDGRHLLAEQSHTCLIGPSTVVLWLPGVGGVRLVTLTASHQAAELLVDVRLIMLMLHEAMPLAIAAEAVRDLCARADVRSGALLVDVSADARVSAASVGGGGGTILIDSDQPRLLDLAAETSARGDDVHVVRCQLDAQDRLVVLAGPGTFPPDWTALAPGIRDVPRTEAAQRLLAFATDIRAPSDVVVLFEPGG